MDLVLLLLPSVLGYHSQGYMAHQVVKYQDYEEYSPIILVYI